MFRLSTEQVKSADPRGSSRVIRVHATVAASDVVDVKPSGQS